MPVAVAKKPIQPTKRMSFDPTDEHLEELLTEWKNRKENPDLQKNTNVKIHEYVRQVYPSFEIRGLITTHQSGLNSAQMTIFNKQSSEFVKVN